MTAWTVNLLRTTYVNVNIQRADGSTKPWTDAECNTAISEALLELWPDVGLYVSATTPTDQADPYYTIPSPIQKVSRITLESSDSGGIRLMGKVDSWRPHTAGMVAIDPIIETNASLQLRFYGWKPYAADASDIPDRLAPVVGYKAAALAYGLILAKLGNFENQLALDSGKVLTYSDATALAAYWQRLYEQRLSMDESAISYAPRASSRA